MEAPTVTPSIVTDKIAAEPGPLPSLEQYLADKEDKEDIQHYKDYFNILVKRYNLQKEKTGKVPEIEAHLLDAKKNLQIYFVGGSVPGLNGAFQILCGPRPGDNLRKITPLFEVDDHQWKHYSA